MKTLSKLTKAINAERKKEMKKQKLEKMSVPNPNLREVEKLLNQDKMKREKQSTLKSVPLLTADKQVISVGSILYKSVFSSYKGTLTTQRCEVIHINPTSRTFVVRHENGVEVKISLYYDDSNCYASEKKSRLSFKKEILKSIKDSKEEIAGETKKINLMKKLIQTMAKRG